MAFVYKENNYFLDQTCTTTILFAYLVKNRLELIYFNVIGNDAKKFVLFINIEIPIVVFWSDIAITSVY